MPRINAFATSEYPVLFTVLAPEDPVTGGPPDHAEISLALLVKGVPSFLATHVVPMERVNPVVTSLESGDVRVAVIGLSVEMPEEAAEMGLDPREEHPAAFVSLVCADGRRLNLARIVGRDADDSPERLARFVVRQIARGAQISELASAP